MTQIEHAPSREDVIAKLAIEVTRSDDPPSADLSMALEQLVDEIQTGEEPSRPVDWASMIAQAVAERHSDG